MDSMKKKFFSCVAQRTRRRDDLYVVNVYNLRKESDQFKRNHTAEDPKKTEEKISVEEEEDGSVSLSGSKRRRLCDGNSDKRKPRTKNCEVSGEKVDNFETLVNNSIQVEKMDALEDSEENKGENFETLVSKNSSHQEVEEKNAIDDSEKLIVVEDDFSSHELKNGRFEEEDDNGSLSGSERRRLCDGNCEEKAENFETLVKSSIQVEEKDAIDDSEKLIVIEDYDEELGERDFEDSEENKGENFETLVSKNLNHQVEEQNVIDDSEKLIVVEDFEEGGFSEDVEDSEEITVTSSYDLRSRRFRDGDSGEIKRNSSDLKESIEDAPVKVNNFGTGEVPQAAIEALKEIVVIDDLIEEKIGSLCSGSTKKRFGCRDFETGTTENIGGFNGPNVETNRSKDKQPLTLKKKSSEQTVSRHRFTMNEPAPVEDPESESRLDDLLAEIDSLIKSSDLEMEQPFPVAKESSEQPGHKLPQRFRYDVAESESVQTLKSGTEFDDLWDDMNFAMKSSQIGLAVSSESCTTVAGGESDMICPAVNHDVILDEEIGMICRICGHVLLEIKYVTSPMLEKHNQGQYTESDRLWFEEEDSLLDRLLYSEPGSKAEDSWSPIEGLVWELIPDVRDDLFPHQRQAFEFIWRNLAGSIELAKLKSSNGDEGCGGCIISHAPGTGKTRLAMVFLQAYLELFPDCRPVIVAPASILLTWAHEFQKWDFKVPFYNLNNLELAEEESKVAKEKLKDIGGRRLSKTPVRFLKLSLWKQNSSILGISYSLYAKLAGEASACKKKVGRKNKKLEWIKETLVEEPGLLVLDEGHTPRNHRSGIWKALLNIKTEKRILLSGTPFQNNFLELCNTLCMARPSFPKTIQSSFKKLWQSRAGQSKRGCRNRKLVGASFRLVEKLDDREIEKLKSLMAPFVHVYKGRILQKDLPGLKDSIIVFNPSELQKQLLRIIDTSQTHFEFEHKEALCSLHPFLFKSSSLSEMEELAIKQLESESKRKACNTLDNEDFRFSDGVKTRFLLELIRLTQSLNEKVLIFSQYIDPLNFLLEQISSFFHWSEGREILHMHGKMEQKQRQALINNFNDSHTEAMVLLASTRACSEGIDLVAASRVVLLDVVWNPSVERQAISRAYRLGQKRVVYTYHLMIQGTQEYAKYCKQTEKHRLSELVFSSAEEDGEKDEPAKALEDRVLDEMVHHQELKGIFRKIIYPKESESLESFSGSVLWQHPSNQIHSC